MCVGRFFLPRTTFVKKKHLFSQVKILRERETIEESSRRRRGNEQVLEEKQFYLTEKYPETAGVCRNCMKAWKYKIDTESTREIELEKKKNEKKNSKTRDTSSYLCCRDNNAGGKKIKWKCR